MVVKFIAITIYMIMTTSLALYKIYLERLSQGVQNHHAEGNIGSFYKARNSQNAEFPFHYNQRTRMLQ